MTFETYTSPGHVEAMPGPTKQRRRVSSTAVLAATVLAAVLVVANVSALNVALPQLSRELGASQSQVQWIIDAYAVLLAALLLPAGALGDRFGRRRMLLFGLVVLAVSNAATLLVDEPLPVILLRALSGVGAAFVFPATLSTITAVLPDEQRGRGVAMWTAAVSIGGIFGVLASGALIENFWWGSVFVAMAIAPVVVLVVCALFVPDSADPGEANLDPVGAVLSFVGIGALVLGIIEGPVEGWTSPVTLAGLIGGSAALIAFVVWEWRSRRPLLDVRLFRERGLRAGSLSIFVQFTAAFGFFFLTVPYLAFVRGFGPLKTGLGLLPAAIGLFPASAIAIPLTRRFGRRIIGVIGLVILASAFVVGTLIDASSPFWLFGLVMALFGLGLGLSSPPATEAIVESLPPARQGVASALNDVLREFGAAIGIAVIGSAFNAGYRSTVADARGFPPEVIEAVREAPAAAAVIAPELGTRAEPLLGTVAEAVLDGWGRALWVTAGLVAVGTLGYLLWAPRRQDSDRQQSDLLATLSATASQPAHHVAMVDPTPHLPPPPPTVAAAPIFEVAGAPDPPPVAAAVPPTPTPTPSPTPAADAVPHEVASAVPAPPPPAAPVPTESAPAPAMGAGVAAVSGAALVEAALGGEPAAERPPAQAPQPSDGFVRSAAAVPDGGFESAAPTAELSGDGGESISRVDMSGRFDPETPFELRVRPIAWDRADLEAVRAALRDVGAGSAADLGMTFEEIYDQRPAHVAIAVVEGDASWNPSLISAVAVPTGHQPADLLVFVRGEPEQLFSGGPDDSIASWLSQRLQSGTARLVALGSTSDLAATAERAIARRSDVWADLLPALAYGPRLGLADIERQGPAGALEIAAAAEIELARITELQRSMRRRIGVLRRRAAVPRDMQSWSAERQAAVVERAAIAAHGPVEEVETLMHAVLERVRTCDTLVAGATAELARVGAEDVALTEMDGRAAVLRGLSDETADELGELTRHFDGLATLHSSLKPAARSLRGANRSLGEACELISRWVD